jgi:hypothetical protein
MVATFSFTAAEAGVTTIPRRFIFTIYRLGEVESGEPLADSLHPGKEEGMR